MRRRCEWIYLPDPSISDDADQTMSQILPTITKALAEGAYDHFLDVLESTGKHDFSLLLDVLHVDPFDQGPR